MPNVFVAQQGGVGVGRRHLLCNTWVQLGARNRFLPRNEYYVEVEQENGKLFHCPSTPSFPSHTPSKVGNFSLSLSNSPGVAGVTRKRRKKREKEDRKAAFAHRRERRKKCGTSTLGWYVWCRHSLAGESPPFPVCALDPASHMRILPIFENAHGTLITQSLPSSRYPAFSLHTVLSSFSSFPFSPPSLRNGIGPIWYYSTIFLCNQRRCLIIS